MGHQREGREKDDPCCKEAFGQAACYIYRAIISRYIYQRRIPLITDQAIQPLGFTVKTSTRPMPKTTEHGWLRHLAKP
jgi:hypothetical protein